jgi:protein SCO1/2
VRSIGQAIALGVGLIVAATSLAVAAGPDPQANRIDPRKALQTSESAVGRQVGDYVLTAANGEVFSLTSYRGKPLIVSLVYSSCSSLCPVTTQHLLDAIEQARRVVGAGQFQVLTVGFDARNDTPARMAQFAANQHIDLPNWRVASADSATIQALLRDLGFSYAEIAGGFDHVTQTTILDADGKVSRQVYGEDFPIRMLIEPLKNAVYGTRTSFSALGILDRIKFICTTFDPGAGRYRINYGLIFGGSLAALSLVLMGGLILREWLRTGRAEAEMPPSGLFRSQTAGNPSETMRRKA